MGGKELPDFMLWYCFEVGPLFTENTAEVSAVHAFNILKTERLVAILKHRESTSS